MAIVDMDFHHGNGTQSIFCPVPKVFFASIHGDPRKFYPFFSGFDLETSDFVEIARPPSPGLCYHMINVL